MPNSFPTQLYLSFILIITLLLYSPGVYSAIFTITNKCSYPVWPGLSSNSQLPTTGFALQPGESNNVSIPESWSGKVWGRTFCTQNATTGNFSCLTGDCASSTVQCSGNSISNPPATLAEFSLNSFNGLDFYDISLVDGYNLPMLISPRGHRAGNCSVIGCVVNLNPACPAELSVIDSSDGETVACKSACLALGDKSQYCCPTLANCTATPYSSFFKVACPQAYSYAKDDQTSIFSCSGEDYVITFCPNNSNTSSKGDNCTTTNNGQTKCVDTTGDTKNATNTSVDTRKGDKFAGWKLGLAVSLPGVGIMFITVYCFMRKLSSSSLFHWRKARNHINIETFLKKHGSLAPTIYTYTQVKKMTNSFNNKLGQGVLEYAPFAVMMTLLL